jgi:hypothetical protein
VDSKHGSGKATISVRVDLQLLMLVLKFNADRSQTSILNLVKLILYIWFIKFSNLRRHRPIRQLRRVPTVLSECKNEDHQCHCHGHCSLMAHRLWRRHHLWFLLQKIGYLWSRLLSTHRSELFLCESIFSELLVCFLGQEFPCLCTLLSLF